jgi:hypothetical protein
MQAQIRHSSNQQNEKGNKNVEEKLAASLGIQM